MKATKVVDLRNKKAGELETEIANARDEIRNLRFQQVTGQLTDTSRMRVLRGNIARMLTVLREQSKAEVSEGEA